MEKYILFIQDLLIRIAKTQDYSGLDSLKLNHHSGKDYWTIDFVFSSGNSKYTDCVVFYLKEDSFKEEEIFADFDEILAKANPFLK